MGRQLPLFASRREIVAEQRAARIVGAYRYTLSRVWSTEAAPDLALFVMLNPSTADAEVDDPTVRSCRRLAKAFRCGGFVAVNLFAWRATEPEELFGAHRDGADVVGPDNDAAIAEAAGAARVLIAAWGANARWPLVRDRAERLLASILPARRPVYCLGLTRAGHPTHPLFVPSDRELSIYRGVRADFPLLQEASP